jgi:hypothetical protein
MSAAVGVLPEYELQKLQFIMQAVLVAKSRPRALMMKAWHACWMDDGSEDRN